MLHIRRCWNWASVSSRIKARPHVCDLDWCHQLHTARRDDPTSARHAQRAALGSGGSEIVPRNVKAPIGESVSGLTLGKETLTSEHLLRLNQPAHVGRAGEFCHSGSTAPKVS